MKYIVVIGIALFVIGCSNKKEVKIVDIIQKEVKIPDTPKKKVLNTTIQDLVRIPQNIENYTSYIQDDGYMVNNQYEKAYFSVWNMAKPTQSIEDIQWPFKSFNPTTSYGENLLPVGKSFFEAMHKESNFKNYLRVSKKGVILKYTNIRALPTSKPLLRDPSLAGEGFPFDYLQNSSISANVPVFISHYSLDKQWVFVFSRFTYGWVKNEDVIGVDNNYAALWQGAKQIHIIKEGIPLFTQSNEPLYNTRIGMMFAVVSEDSKSYTVLTISRFKNDEAMFNKTRISKQYASLSPLALSKNNLNMIINEVSKTNYGWGGVYGQRDCSSTLMDLFAPFGLALPRNSSKQAEVGKVIDLSKLTNPEKLQTIKDKAIPFETLLYKKGHIVLYAGIYEDEVIVFHNTWGIKIKDKEKEGRFIIGKPIFSTLTIGSKLYNYDKEAELLRNIKSMNIITK